MNTEKYWVYQTKGYCSLIISNPLTSGEAENLSSQVKEHRAVLSSAHISFLLCLPEFSLSSFCSSVDMTNFSKLRMLRLDANEIGAKDIPAEAAYCLRHVAFIDV